MIAYNTNHKLNNNRYILIEIIRGLGANDGISKEEKEKILNILENNSKSIFDNKFWEILTQIFIKVDWGELFEKIKDLDISKL